MSKIKGGFRKETGRYRWTRRGMVKLPDELRPIRIRVSAKKKPGKPAKEPAKANKRVVAVSAPTLAPMHKKLTTGQRRPAWHGKYDDLTPPKE